MPGKPIDEVLEEMLERWSIEKNLEKRKVSKTILREIYPIFSNYDSWKTASRDDYVEERSVSSLIDKEEVFDLARSRWHEEFNEHSFEEAEYDMEFMYKESCSLFNQVLSDYEREYEFEFEY